MSKFGLGFIFHPAAGGTPTITVSPASVDTTPGVQSYSLTGTNLTADITITIGGATVASVEISQTSSSSGFGAGPLTVVQSGGNVSATIWARKPVGYNPISGTYAANLANSSPGATTKNVATSYTQP